MTSGAKNWIAAGNRGLILGLALFLSLVLLSWVGFIASDDATFAKGAYGWIDAFPGLYVGGHGTIRYLITIPMALSFAIFGENSFAMVLPSLLYVLGFLIITWRITRTVVGPLAAALALGLLATSPLLVIQSSISNVDVVEMFFLFASVYLVWHCIDTAPDAKRLFLAGVMAGCAFLTRETAIFIAVFYAILFVAGHRFHRKHYLWIAAGFMLTWCVELAYLWAMTGDPLYRFNISMHHDSSIDRTVDLAGNVIAHPLIDPLLVLLFNQEFMVLFLVAIPLGGWLSFARGIDPRVQHFARIIALFGLVWFLSVGAAQSLLPLNPRYFMITCAAGCILTGIALAQIEWRRLSRFWPVVLGGLILGTNLLAIYVENKDSAFAERTLAALTERYRGTVIITDPATRLRVKVLLRWERAQDQVVAGLPKAGKLYFSNPRSVEKPNYWIKAEDLAAYSPKPGWREVARFEPDVPYAARAIEALGLDALMPQPIWRKLRYRHPPVSLYAVPSIQQNP